MLFSSITFIYYFLPITLILYFCVPVGHGSNSLRGKNSLLLLASFLFYACGEPIYVLLMLVSVIVGYLGGRLLEKFPHKLLLGCFIGIQLSLLGIFKYTDFFIDIWNQVTSMKVSFLYLTLPIGISFYSFQIISYLVDVYRLDMKVEKSVINFAAYITMFPQLIAGPIVRYEVVQKQMIKREISLANVSEGATRFLVGLGKKVLIADNLAELLLRIESLSDKSIWTYWLMATMYTLQVYHDFSGYSDMAIGLGKMLGFSFPENFKYPLISRSVSEFWRRWHISLGTFLKDYIYIPLKGSKCGRMRWCVNIGIVWFLSGLWHGASWNFVLWGLYFGVFIICEKIIGQQLNKRRWTGKFKLILHGIQHIYLCAAIIISFVLFRFVEISKVKAFIVEMFRVSNYKISWIEWYEYKNVALLVLIGMIGATPFVANAIRYLCEKIENETLIGIMEIGFQILMLVIVTAYLIQSSVHPFLYFRF